MVSIRFRGSRIVQSTSRFRVLENGSAVRMSSEERKKPSFISTKLGFSGLPIFRKRGTKIHSGRLLSSEEWKTKIRSGGLPKIRGTKIRSGGFPTNGKREPRFILRILVWGLSIETEQASKVYTHISATSVKGGAKNDTLAILYGDSQHLTIDQTMAIMVMEWILGWGTTYSV
ncbi:hypothetical protein RhiirA5_432512 [Rhizophagus irregularis]|uniref:Uncharacterized protein n=1 Tax=Rhizophagus irregularis TaxID=588596 RepID=A0A2N0NT70_9GLOM|nr:hypothetical protein RhiirA5_432512 [Rhizophagus irregularis]